MSGSDQSVNCEFLQFYAFQTIIPIFGFFVPDCASHQQLCPPAPLTPALFQSKKNIGQASVCPNIRLFRVENKHLSKCVS